MNRFLGRVGTSIVDFGVDEGRDAAWSFARMPSPLAGPARTRAIDEKNVEVALLSKLVSGPGIVRSTVLVVVRLGERRTTRERIAVPE